MPRVPCTGTALHNWELTLPVLSVDMLRVACLGHRGRQLGTGEVPVALFFSVGWAWEGETDTTGHPGSELGATEFSKSCLELSLHLVVTPLSYLLGMGWSSWDLPASSALLSFKL